MKWEKVKLGSLCERILSGGTPSTDIKEYWNGEIPWISSSDIKDHTSLLITKGISASLNPNILPAGNIIVVTRVGLGKVIGNDVDLAFSQDLQGLILKSNIHRQYLIYALLKEVARFKNISRGATIKGVTKEDLVNIEIPLPPLHIQQQIADTLDKADALRRKDQELLNKYDELAKAIFYDMFGDPAINHHRWNTFLLSELTDCITKGESPKWQGYEYQEKGILFITSENVGNGKMILEEKRKYIPFEFHMKLKRSQIKFGDVLINLVGASIGRCAVFNYEFEEANINQAVSLIRCKNNLLLPEYLCFLLQTSYMQKVVKKDIVEAARGNISLGDINHYKIMLPPISLQKKFRIAVEQCNQVINHTNKFPHLFNVALDHYFS